MAKDGIVELERPPSSASSIGTAQNSITSSSASSSVAHSDTGTSHSFNILTRFLNLWVHRGSYDQREEGAQ